MFVCAILLLECTSNIIVRMNLLSKCLVPPITSKMCVKHPCHFEMGSVTLSSLFEEKLAFPLTLIVESDSKIKKQQ